MMQEKRARPRITVGLPAFLDPGMGTDACIKVHAIDLSVEGMSVCSPLALAKGALCRVTMSIPGKQARNIHVTCAVIYSVLSNLSCEFRLGLEFVELQSDARAILQEYLDWRGAGAVMSGAPAALGYASPRD